MGDVVDIRSALKKKEDKLSKEKKEKLNALIKEILLLNATADMLLGEMLSLDSNAKELYEGFSNGAIMRNDTLFAYVTRPEGSMLSGKEIEMMAKEVAKLMQVLYFFGKYHEFAKK